MQLRAGLRGVDQRLLVHRCGGGAACGRAALLTVLRGLDLQFSQTFVVERVSVFECGRHALAESSQQPQALFRVEIDHAERVVQRFAEHLGPQRVGLRRGVFARAQAVEPRAQIAHLPLGFGFEHVREARDFHPFLEIGFIDQTERLELQFAPRDRLLAENFFVEHLMKSVDEGLDQSAFVLPQRVTHVGELLPIPPVARRFGLLFQRLDDLAHDRAHQLVRAGNGVIDAGLENFGRQHGLSDGFALRKRAFFTL